MIENITEHPNWYTIELHECESEIANELNKEIPNRVLLVNWLKEKFKMQSNLGNDLPEDEGEKLFTSWLNFQLETSDLPIFFRKYLRLQSLVSLTFSHKVNSIAQRHCQICNPVNAHDDPFPVYHFPLRIAGKSRQSISPSDFIQYQSAIRRRLNRNEVKRKDFEEYCLTLTFVMNKSKRDRDIDNMSKTLLDATSRALGFNDSKVVHLNAAKLIFPQCEERVFIRLGPSFLNSHQDVCITKPNQSWAGEPPLVD